MQRKGFFNSLRTLRLCVKVRFTVLGNFKVLWFLESLMFKLGHENVSKLLYQAPGVLN